MRRPFIFIIFSIAVSSPIYAQDFIPQNGMAEFITHFDADRGNLSRFYVISNSPERRQRFQKFYSDYEKKLASLDFAKMNTGDKVDYVLLKRRIENELQLLDKEKNETEQIANFFPFSEYIYDLEKLRRRGAYLNSEEVAKKLNEIQKDVSRKINTVQGENSIAFNLADRAVATVKGLQSALKSTYEFYNGYDPLFTWWVAKPYKQLDSILNVYAGVLLKKSNLGAGQKDDGSGIVGTPIGREELLRQLNQEMIPYSPEELVAIANKEFEWCDREMLKASREMGFGDDWKKALEKVKMSFVPAGKQPEMIMGLYNESVAFLKKNDLLTIPPLADESWRMTMMTPERQLVAPFFLGGETLLIAYPTNTMDHDAKMMSLRGNNPHFSRAVVHHELIAGHGLQWYMNQRYNTHRNFWTPFWTEGWALYWEMILWDKNFPRSPEDKIGMLFWRMHRCARIIFSLNYHLGKWTPQQCIDFLVDRVGHERANAEGEVRRSFTGGYGPLYQLAYMIGALQFYQLKKEVVDRGKLSLKQYHDAVLKENNIPVEMLRAILLDQPPTKNFKSNWRFYDLK